MDEQTRNQTLNNMFGVPGRIDNFIGRTEEKRGSGQNKKRRPWWIWLVLGLALIALVGLVFLFFNTGQASSSYDPNKWQAVFLDNNQVFFGHIVREDQERLILREIYYPQKPLILQQGEEQKPNDFTIVKFGGEIYGTEDEMVIGKDNVLYVSNLKEESKIIQAIKKYQEKK